jgi:hypothetical protein
MNEKEPELTIQVKADGKVKVLKVYVGDVKKAREDPACKFGHFMAQHYPEMWNGFLERIGLIKR